MRADVAAAWGATWGETWSIALSPANVIRLFSRSSGLTPKLALAAGVSYLFLPIDLIPDRLGLLVGHLDEAGLLLLGFAGGLLLAMPRPAPLYPARWLPATLLLRFGWRIARGGGGGLAGRVMLRLILGRWPDAGELDAFDRGLGAEGHGLPPLMRAAAYVPAARELLGRAMLLGNQLGGGTARPLAPAQMMGNPLALWRGPKVRFLHLEKTAGSSLIAALATQFHPLQIHSATDRREPPPGQTAEAVRRAERAGAHRQAEAVWGHYDLPTLQRLDAGQPCFRFCLLRPPRQRILSLYYFWRSNQTLQDANVRFARENRLLAFLRVRDPGIANDIDNMYVRRLTGRYATSLADPLAEDPESALAAALEALDGLDFVGMSDRLGETLQALGRLLDFVPPARTPQVNVQAHTERAAAAVRPVSREPITPEIDAEMLRLTRLDAVLFAHAEARFEALHRALPAPSRLLAEA